MNHFWNYGYTDLLEVKWFLQNMFTSFINSFYENEFSWLFYLALFIPLMSFVFDLLMSFILSIRLREFRFFNVISPKSWRMVNEARTRSSYTPGMHDLKNNPRDIFLKFTRLSSLAVRLNQYKHAKAGDIIRSKDGFKSVYQGVKLNKDGSVLYKYHTNNGILFSTMKPSQWAKSTGSQRMNSVKYSLKKNNK